MKKGMVLEGGAMRGMYSAGVLDVLMENNINVDGLIGVSAGAVFGCNYKSKQIGRVIRYNKKYCQDKRYISLRSLIKTGDLYGVDFCYHELPEKLDVFDNETFINNPIDFYVTCTNVHTGRPTYRKCNRGDATDVKWMQASASMPLVSRIVEVEGFELLDGGISDSIPINWFIDKGFQKNLVVLTQVKGYRKKPSSMMKLLKLGLKKYPAIIEAMATRYLRYNQTLDDLEKLEAANQVLIIQPSKLIKISRTERNPDKLEAMYQLGRKDALAKLEAIKNFLDDN